MLLEEEKKRKHFRRKAKDYGPKIYIKDSIKTGKRVFTYTFDSIRVKRKLFPSISSFRLVW